MAIDADRSETKPEQTPAADSNAVDRSADNQREGTPAERSGSDPDGPAAPPPPRKRAGYVRRKY